MTAPPIYRTRAAEVRLAELERLAREREAEILLAKQVARSRLRGRIAGRLP